MVYYLLKILENKKVNKKNILIFIVAYNAEAHIEDVLDRIPRNFLSNKKYNIEILIIDDSSVDNTVNLSKKYIIENSELSITIFKNPKNQGYGGNQKIGYLYMLKQKFDIVILLHGDGQYAPEYIPKLIEPILTNEADVVFGSRMINKKEALKGGMPLYKYFGNQFLTTIQNKLLDSELYEFHSGYRVYSRKVIEKIPFHFNSNDFDFDTDIIIQIIDNGFRIKELSIPTFYGNEICNVNGIKYAWNILKSTILSRMQRKMQLFYSPKFDYEDDNNFYTDKTLFDSSHKFAIDQVNKGSIVIDIGSGPGVVAKKLFKKSCTIYGIDEYIQDKLVASCKNTQKVNLDFISENTFEFNESKLDVILLLDIIEHIRDADNFLAVLRNRFSPYNPKVVVTTANIAFFIMRISLLFGTFQYGKKGILDKTHTRLYTFSSLKRLLKDAGYVIEDTRGIPIPFPLIFGENIFSHFLLSLNNFLIRISKGLFSYQIAIITNMTPSLDFLLEQSRLEGKINSKKSYTDV
jgi:2-polyprenyl-3-methyl-5-hydroxy-6-metoxy-1,4-benzoquinol methylase